jgi:hypothetical protein
MGGPAQEDQSPWWSGPEPKDIQFQLPVPAQALRKIPCNALKNSLFPYVGNSVVNS